MVPFLFVGEKPSKTAFDRGLTWKDGKLAAKTLFDALRFGDIDPLEQAFVNLFGNHPDDPLTETNEVKARLEILKASAHCGTRIVALGSTSRLSQGSPKPKASPLTSWCTRAT